MRLVCYLSFIAILATVSNLWAQTYSQLEECVAGAIGNFGSKDSHTAILSGDANKTKASLLVLNKDGAKIVESANEYGLLSFVFVAPGGKERMKALYPVNDKGGVDNGWGSSRGVTEELSKQSDVTPDQAAEFAAHSWNRKIDELGTLEDHKKLMESFLRTRDTLSNGKKKVDVVSDFGMNEERVQQAQQSIDDMAAALKRCNQIPNPKIRNAVAKQEERLQAFREMLADIRKRSELARECVKEKMNEETSQKTTRAVH